MKHSAKDGLCRNVLPLPYRVQIHMNLLDHRHLSVNQVRYIVEYCFSLLSVSGRAGGAGRIDYGKINILAGIYSNENT